ncbi:MAG: PQQ-dependent sugar dehydrogenase, partial [Cellulomonas sp.]
MAMRRTTRVRSAVAVTVVALLALVAACGPDSPAPTGTAPTTASSPAVSGEPSGPATVEATEVDEILGDLEVPWGLAFLPDGEAVVTLREAAQLVLVGPDGAATTVTGPGADQLRDVVVPAGEGGLLGVAVLGSSGGSVDLAL